MDQLRISSAEYELTGLEDRDEDTGNTSSRSPILIGRKEGKLECICTPKKTRVLLHVSKRAFYVSAQTVLFVESKNFLICYQSVDIIDKEASHISHHGD